MAFADLFTFSRMRSGLYTDAAGVPRLAAINQPRFDHHEDGEPRGLLVEGRPQFEKADVVAGKVEAWPSVPATVLHEYETPAFEIRRRAVYTSNSLAVVNALVNIKGWHRRIGAVPGFLKNRGGYVTFRDERYALGGVLAVAPYVLLDAVGGDSPTPIIES